MEASDGKVDFKKNQLSSLMGAKRCKGLCGVLYVYDKQMFDLKKAFLKEGQAV